MEAIASLPAVLEALWRGRQLRFTYEKAGEPSSERVVEPLGLVARGSVWYLVADKGEQRRTYRVSRMADAAPLEQAGRRPAGFDLASHWETAVTQFRATLPRYDATFLAEPAVMPWIRYRGWRLQHETPAGDRVRVQLRFDLEDEAVHFALGFGAAVEVLEPDALRARVRSAAAQIVALYATAATPRLAG